MNYDKQVISAFNELVSVSSRHSLLGEIARHPLGRQEATIEMLFRKILRSQLEPNPNIEIPPDKYKEHYGPIHDIVGKHDLQTIMVVEIKTPFTDPGGIAFKTKKPEGLPKDICSLGKALEHGVPAAYELVAMFECYGVDKKGKFIQASNDEFLTKYGIRWPTERGYDPGKGEQKVNQAMAGLARERNLKVKRKGWRRVELPRPVRKVRPYLDCALYKVQLK